MKEKNNGFTLIELLVAIMIFAIISVISYRTLDSLVTTQKIVTQAQQKWGGLSKALSKFSAAFDRAIPLPVNNGDGIILPAVYGKNKLDTKYDSQLELTLNGFSGDPHYGFSPPVRIGFRYLNGELYYVSWPVLNRVPSTVPSIYLLLNGINQFKIEYFYLDRVWRDTYPMDNSSYTKLPIGVRLYIKLDTGEEVTRQWAL